MVAGMINLGKTHTMEFAYGGWGTNQYLGTPWNPWDDGTHRTGAPVRSGFGVAVAARMAPWAIGTDTGMSVCIPAAWSGVTGLKTTIGRISTLDILPLSPTLDTPGPITRDVEDAARLLAVLQGEDRRDRHTLGVHDVDPVLDLHCGVKDCASQGCPPTNVTASMRWRSPAWMPRSSIWHGPRGSPISARSTDASCRPKLTPRARGTGRRQRPTAGPGGAAARARRGGDLVAGLARRACREEADEGVG